MFKILSYKSNEVCISTHTHRDTCYLKKIKIQNQRLTDGYIFWFFPFLHSANIVLFPFSYLINSSSEGSRNPIADSSLQVLLVLIHYHKCLVSEGYSVLKNQVSASSDSSPKDNTYFSDNPYCRALERAIDCECNISFIFYIRVLLTDWKCQQFFNQCFKCSGLCR